MDFIRWDVFATSSALAFCSFGVLVELKHRCDGRGGIVCLVRNHPDRASNLALSRVVRAKLPGLARIRNTCTASLLVPEWLQKTEIRYVS